MPGENVTVRSTYSFPTFLAWGLESASVFTSAHKARTTEHTAVVLPLLSAFMRDREGQQRTACARFTL